MDFSSWGNIFKISPNEYQQSAWQDQVFIDPNQKQLACGLRPSYGDICLIKQGKLFDDSHIERVINFDSHARLLLRQQSSQKRSRQNISM